MHRPVCVQARIDLADLQGGSTLLKPLYWEIISTCQCLGCPRGTFGPAISAATADRAAVLSESSFLRSGLLKSVIIVLKKRKNLSDFALLKNRPKSVQKHSEVHPSSQKKPFSEIGTEIVRSFCHSATNKEILRSETHESA